MAKPAVPDNISEEYYQISQAILESFPKYRLPLNLFKLDEKSAALFPYYTKDSRLTNEKIEEVHELCSEGNLFVARSDHPVYSKHIAKQLDLILIDKNLKEAEIADICIHAMELRLGEFFEQPVRLVFDILHADILVLTEYLWLDMHRIGLFTRRLHTGEHSLAKHSINTMITGLWLYVNEKGSELSRKDFDHAAAALLLHDIGMTKVPAFILSKTTPLKPEEKEKIPLHPFVGLKVMQKLEQTHDLMNQAVMEHHERLDGSGYPQKLRDINPFSRLTAVADAFSAMIQTRPYAEAKPALAAAKELADQKSRFDFHLSSKLLAALVSNTFGKVQQ
ncbi:HD domain-containing protein [Desulfovibrio sp. OttesenSCG-928-G15]|nr:HD domain-containing protein [Desulfovibrio sp. OttesenSCG-928-G15]